MTTVVGSLAGVKWVTEDELALLPAAITQPALLNARAGPGLTYDILTTVPQGTWARITAIDTQGDWYRVELDDLDQPAWIFRDFTKSSRRLADRADPDRSGRYPVANGWATDQFDHGRTVVAAGRRGRS